MPTQPYISRINQVDACQLDDEIYKVLKSQTQEITKCCPPGSIDKWQPEIDAFLRILIWNFSLRRGSSTFGQQLLNLTYDNFNRKKSILYLTLTVVPKYIREKFADNRLSLTTDRTAKIRNYIEWFGCVLSLLEFINLLSFLHRGTQPRMIERLLSIRSKSSTIRRPRDIGYSYMTRELLWHGLIELFTVGLPLINYYYLKDFLVRLWKPKKKPNFVSTVPKLNLSTKCSYCDDSVILPTHAGCEHIFCYYCLKAHFMAMDTIRCQKCGVDLHSRDLKFYIADPGPQSITDEFA